MTETNRAKLLPPQRPSWRVEHDERQQSQIGQTTNFVITGIYLDFNT